MAADQLPGHVSRVVYLPGCFAENLFEMSFRNTPTAGNIPEQTKIAKIMVRIVLFID